MQSSPVEHSPENIQIFGYLKANCSIPVNGNGQMKILFLLSDVSHRLRMPTDSNNSSHNSTQAQRWDEQTAWHLHAECENGQRQINDECHNQQPNGFNDTGTGFCAFDGRIDIGEIAIVITAMRREDYLFLVFAFMIHFLAQLTKVDRCSRCRID